ncbi:MAG TPA: ATP-binding protein, partial [Steroidobacteraceae bacterium]|nr:ATP-binding protein [Steroidobacteraceae bacterium]
NKLLRVVVNRVAGTNRIVGVITECGAKREELLAANSQNLWQSVGRLTLLDEVTSAMAHELNQPLAAISMFAQVGERMLSVPEPRLDKARQIFSDVSQQALRAGDLIHNMRNLVKRHPPSKIKLRVADLINGFVSLAQPMARTHHVEFVVPNTFPAAIVFVDVTQINQVLSILFQNALDAVGSSDARRKVIAVGAEQVNDKILISITDSGSGVADSATSQLFQAFFSTKENGNGLGLVSARNILEVYGSRIEFTNLTQGGCRFSFSLPVESRFESPVEPRA